MIKNKIGKKLQIKVYTFTELAIAYNPNTSKEVARVKLNAMIKRNPNLINDLKKLGYDLTSTGRKYSLTPKMIYTIFERLGTPYNIEVELI